jgi:DNA (cytosine-5)-methyltransferase 1
MIFAADLFCGAGGTSTGLIQAAQALGLDVNLLAINHWNLAIATHSANHPGVEHRCEDLDNVNPRKVVPGGYLDLLVASPECMSHSRARGGTPKNDQSRATAFHVLRWAEALYVKDILIENVIKTANQ